MKTIVQKGTLALLVPLSAFSFEVNFNKTFTKELMSDTLSTNITIRMEATEEKEISKHLTKFNEEIKDNDDVEKRLGRFTIRPSYKYSSTHTPKIIGYIGELRYTINSDNAKSIDEFITSLNDLKERRGTSISVSNLSWKVKEDTYNVALDVLRLEAIMWGGNYAYNLSADLKKRCKVKNIAINDYHQPTPLRANIAMEAMSLKKSAVPVPQNSHQKITINPQYTLECK